MSDISVLIHPWVVWYLRKCETKFRGNFAFKSPFLLLLVLLLLTKKTDDEISFAIDMLRAACLSQQSYFHMQQVQMQTIASNGN